MDPFLEPPGKNVLIAPNRIRAGLELQPPLKPLVAGAGGLGFRPTLRGRDGLPCNETWPRAPEKLIYKSDTHFGRRGWGAGRE